MRRQIVDDMVKLLRDGAERLGPGRGYMKTLQTQEELVREIARQALSSPHSADHPFGDQLNDQAGSIVALRAEARDICEVAHAEHCRRQKALYCSKQRCCMRAWPLGRKPARGPIPCD